MVRPHAIFVLLCLAGSSPSRTPAKPAVAVVHHAPVCRGATRAKVVRRPLRSLPTLPSQGRAEVAGIPFYVDVTGGADADATLPMALVLHGLGARPSHFRLFADCPVPLRVVRPQGPLRFGDGFSWFDLSARDGDPGAARAIRAQSVRLAAFLVELTQRYPTEGKPLVAGFSQGGMLSFALAVLHPDAIRSAHPLSGWLPQALWPLVAAEAPAPIHVQHGGRDAILPLLPTSAVVDALERVDVPVTFEVHPNARHTVTRPMREQLCARVVATLGRR